MEEKKEITSRIKGLVQDRIESGLSQAPQGNSGASPAGKPNGGVGNSSNGSDPGRGQQRGAFGRNGIRDRLSQGARNKAQGVKDRVNERVKNSSAYNQVSSKLEAARVAVKKQAEDQFNKVAGEPGRKALEAKRNLNLIKNKIAAKKKALKKALNTRARKSHASSGTVKIVFIVTLVLAIVVDALDIAGEVLVELGMVPTLIAYLINLNSSLVITIAWFMIFSGHPGTNSRQARMIIRSIMLLFGLESVPIIEMLPFNAIAVILNYIDYRAGLKEEQ